MAEDGEIIIVSVAAKLRRVQFESRKSIREANEKAIEEAEGYVAHMKAKFDDSYNVTTKVVTGFPSDSINKLAEDTGADLIIISASGKSGLKKGNKGLMTAFGIIVIFLLVSAVFNYINLSTALTGKRSKEAATRMLLGKTKKEILRTNLAESFAFMFLCMCMAFLIAHLCIPLVNRLLNSPIPIEMKFSQGYIFMYLAIMGISAIFCAIAPARCYC